VRPDLQAGVAAVAGALRGRLGCAVVALDGTEWAALNADEVFPAASVIKIPILLALAAEVDAGRRRWDERPPGLSQEGAGGSGVIQHLTALPYTLRDLAALMIITSDNRATNAIIDLVGMDEINAYLRRGGFGSTVLRRRMMDLEARARGRENVSTPRETADQLRRLCAGELASPETTALLLQMLRAQAERDRLPAWLPPGVPAGNKTGTLPGIVNDAAIFFFPSGPVAAAVFADGVRATPEGRHAIEEIGRAVIAAAGAAAT
jgi:beta-lactamase class A